jgi:hypothetical protein
MLNEEPIWEILKMLQDEPSHVVDRIESADPSVQKSMNEVTDPTRNREKTDWLEPDRTTPRIESVDPAFRKSRTDREHPRRALE